MDFTIRKMERLIRIRLKMGCLGVALGFVFGFGAPVNAQQLLGEYLTYLGFEDTVNSSGQKLGSFCAVVAQDRANFHRFGVRHSFDTTDPFFESREARSKLAAYCEAGRTVERYIRDDVMSGRGHYVYIRVMGTGRQITHVDVYEGAG